MSSTTCTSLPQLEKVHTIAGTTQRSRAQVHPPTTPCAVDALLQYSARALTSCVLHREQWRTGTATVGVERRVVPDNAATDGGRWWSARSDDAGRGECWRRLVDGYSFWRWERRAEFLQRCDGREGIGRRCCVARWCCWVTSSGWRCCGRSGGGA